jgi:integrase/recombinase XerD
MSELRRRMVESMQLHGLALSTQETYVRCIRNLAAYYRESPDQLSDEQIRRFFLHLLNERKLSESTFRTHRFAVKFLYEVTLERTVPVLKNIHPRRRKKLPVILSPEEVACILERVRHPAARACLWTIYSCGLRRAEATRIEVGDIDSSRMVIRIRMGKGGKDRYVPLPQHTLLMLRAYWAAHRPPGALLFVVQDARPLCPQYLGKIFKAALVQSGVGKQAAVHTLRHSYATHLLENQVNLRVIQEVLGHASPRTTAIYTHVTNKGLEQMRTALDTLLPRPATS